MPTSLYSLQGHVALVGVLVLSNGCWTDGIGLGSDALDPVPPPASSACAPMPSVDGAASDDAWVGPAVPIAEQLLGSGANPQASFQAYWSDTSLVLLVQSSDRSLSTDSTDPWDDSSVEVYVDANNDDSGRPLLQDDFQFVARCSDGPVWERLGRTAGVEAVCSAGDGYTMEILIPWALLGVQARSLLSIGLDVGINVDSNGGDRDDQWMWSGTSDNWQDTEAYGSAQLLDGCTVALHAFGEPNGVSGTDPGDPGSDPGTTTGIDPGSGAGGAGGGSTVGDTGTGGAGGTVIDTGIADVPSIACSGGMTLTVPSHTSSSVSLAWSGASTGLTVQLAAEPASSTTAALPSPKTLATLTSGSSYVVTGLAAGTDAFLRVATSSAACNAHVRLAGGPRSALDTPLREVHGFGASVLQLVLANPATVFGSSSSNLGASWQGGTWSVQRADGRNIDVVAVYRHSIPVGQPSYPEGYEQWGDDNVVDVDHRIFLQLAEAIGSREVLHVAHSGDSGTALDVLVPFSDRYLETPLVQVNQVGYNPRAARRYAYVSGWMGDGGAVSLGNLPATAEVLVEPLDGLAARRVALSGLAITVRSANDSDSGGEVRQIDLSSLPAAEGVRYRVRIPGVGVSFPTAVSEEAAFKAFYAVWRGMFHNRWCGDLAPAYTEWTRPADHCSAYFVQAGVTLGFFPESTPQTDLRAVVGGHHDAGDFDIRPYHVVVAQYLMRAYEMDPTRFADGQLNIPESGNGIPDVLDEALWSVAGWVALQNPDGSVRSGVESYRHPAGYYYANEDELPWWTHDPLVWHTAYTAGLFAQAAYLVQPFDRSRADDLTTRARSAYSWAKERSAPVEYLLYGASELYRLTGEASFKADYETYWANIDTWGRGAFDNLEPATSIYPGSFATYTPAMADFVMGYYNATDPDPAIEAVTLAQMTERADAAADRVLASSFAHRNGRPGGPDWGGATSTGRHVDIIYQRLQLGGLTAQKRQDYVDALSLSADWVLGCNPASYSFITGLGSRSPEEPLHTDSLAFIKDQNMPPVPGIPVYGPVASFPGAYYYQAVGAGYYPAFNEQPLGYHLSDNRTAVNMSEFTIWESQAPTAELFAALVADGMRAPASWNPGGSEHRSTLPGHSAE